MSTFESYQYQGASGHTETFYPPTTKNLAAAEEQRHKMQELTKDWKAANWCSLVTCFIFVFSTAELILCATSNCFDESKDGVAAAVCANICAQPGPNLAIVGEVIGIVGVIFTCLACCKN